MEQEKVRELAEKVKNGTSTAQEELELLKFLNTGVEEMRTFIKQVGKENK